MENFERVTFNPASEAEWLSLRHMDVTSTQVPALFNASPYLTFFECWHHHAGLLESTFEKNERVVWGNRLEDAIAKGIAEDNGWQIRRAKEYMRIPALKLGSSFDFEIMGQDALLEIKNVDSLQFKENWVVENGELTEAPPSIEFQAQTQLLVSGKKEVYIGALVGGNKVQLLKRTPDPALIGPIVDRVKFFWDTITVGKPPMPDFERDGETIKRLFGYASEKVFEVGDDDWFSAQVARYQEASALEKQAEAVKTEVRFNILSRIGDASKAVGSFGTISAGMVKGGERRYTVEPYRQFRIFPSKKKK